MFHSEWVRHVVSHSRKAGNWREELLFIFCKSHVCCQRWNIKKSILMRSREWKCYKSDCAVCTIFLKCCYLLWKTTMKEKEKNNNQRKKTGKRRIAPSVRTLLTDGLVSLLLAWTRAARLCLPGYELLKHLRHMCTADWVPSSNKMNYRGSPWCKLDAFLGFFNFQALCFQPKLVLKYLACELVAEQRSKKSKWWNGSSPKRLLSKEPFCLLSQCLQGQSREVGSEETRGPWC